MSIYVSIPPRHRNIGSGLGGIFSSLKQFVKPLFSKTKDIFLKPLAKEGINLLTDTARGVLEGEKPSEALKKNFQKSKKRVIKKGKKGIKKILKNQQKTTAGKGKGKGKGKKKKTKKIQKKSKKRSSVPKSIFDNYT